MNTVETIQSGSLDIVLGEAKIALEQTVSTLNTSFGGRYLFSGAATDTPPFKSAEAIADGLEAAVTDAATTKGGPLTQTETSAAIAAFFDVSANFYDGSAVGSAPVELRDGVRMDYAVNVGDPATEKNDAIRSVLRELATIVVLKDLEAAGQLENGAADEQALYKAAGAALLGGVSKLTNLRADLGVAESAIERTQAHNAAERDALEQARAKIMARDPYEAATEIARLETQLQSIYAMTARSASLSLVNFLR
jgi:flagellar hook-associated protein 3 FlgL